LSHIDFKAPTYYILKSERKTGIFTTADCNTTTGIATRKRSSLHYINNLVSLFRSWSCCWQRGQPLEVVADFRQLQLGVWRSLCLKILRLSLSWDLSGALSCS